MAVTLALSLLCENPRRRTGLTTFFHGFIAEALRQFPDVHWLLFAGPGQAFDLADPRIEIVRDFPANDRRLARLWADHLQVGPEARRRGAQALLTVGFGPLRTAGLPLVLHVFTLHHLRPGGGVRAAYRRLALARGLRQAALVITNSHWAADQLGGARTLVSPEGLDHERFRPEGSSVVPGVPPDSLLWVSNFYPYKRVELAMAAYAQLSPVLRHRHPFVLVGGDWAGGLERAKTQARALGVADDTRFLGWVEDSALPAMYRGARGYVLSTAEETFGRTVTEAMACGCPCVLQDLPVLREVAADAALWVDFADPVASGNALRSLLTDPALAERLRVSGRQRAAEFSFARLARERVTAMLEHVKHPA